jgi:hypothetical protein
MKSPLIAALVLFLASVAQAQSKAVKVLVVASNPESKEVSDRLAGLIGSSSRYALVSNAVADVDVIVGVSCLSSEVAGQKVGVVCHSDMSYLLIQDVPFDTRLTDTIATGNESYVAQSLFDNFVQETSDEKLSEKASDFKSRLNVVISRYPHGIS